VPSFAYVLAVVRNGDTGTYGGDYQNLTWEYLHIEEPSVLHRGLAPGSAVSAYIYENPPTIYWATDVGGFVKIVDNAGTYGVFDNDAGDLEDAYYDDIDAGILSQVANGIMYVNEGDDLQLTWLDTPGVLNIVSFKIVRIGYERLGTPWTP